MISVSDIEIQPLREGGSFGRWLMVLAVFAGLALTLYRNDVLRQAATNVGAGAAYARLERALGGPSFGTPRAVEELAASDGRAPAAAAGPSTAAAAPATAPAVPATTAPAAPVATSPEKPAAAVAAPEPSAVSLDSLPLEQKVGASISAELLKPKGTVSANPAPAARPKASSPRQSTSSVAKQVTQKRRARGSASDYDPLNGKL